MARGGYRFGAGRKRGSKDSKPRKKRSDRIPMKAPVSATIPAGAGNQTPLEFMLQIMRDSAQANDFRARMAIAAAPYVHHRAGAAGKKTRRTERAKVAGKGRFKPTPAPLKLLPSRAIENE